MTFHKFAKNLDSTGFIVVTAVWNAFYFRRQSNAYFRSKKLSKSWENVNNFNIIEQMEECMQWFIRNHSPRPRQHANLLAFPGRTAVECISRPLFRYNNVSIAESGYQLARRLLTSSETAAASLGSCSVRIEYLRGTTAGFMNNQENNRFYLSQRHQIFIQMYFDEFQFQ